MTQIGLQTLPTIHDLLWHGSMTVHTHLYHVFTSTSGHTHFPAVILMEEREACMNSCRQWIKSSRAYCRDTNLINCSPYLLKHGLVKIPPGCEGGSNPFLGNVPGSLTEGNLVRGVPGDHRVPL